MDLDVIREEKRIGSFIAGAIVLLVAAFLAISILIAVFPLPSTGVIPGLPGDILFNVYGFSAFLVPCLLLYAAILLLIPGWTLRSGILLAGSVFPFFTVVTAERLTRSVGLPILNPSVGRLVTAGIAVSAALAVMIEYLFLLHLGDRLVSRAVIGDAAIQSGTEPESLSEMETESVSEVESEFVSELESEPEPECESGFGGGDDPESSLVGTPLEESLPDVALPAESPTVEPISDGNESGASAVDSNFFDRSAHVPSVAAPSVVDTTPMYVDFEKMKAPFDLPVIEDWVESSQAQSPVQSTGPSEIPSTGEDAIFADDDAETLAETDEINEIDEIAEIEDDDDFASSMPDDDAQPDALLPEVDDDELDIVDGIEDPDISDALPPVLTVPPQAPSTEGDIAPGDTDGVPGLAARLFAKRTRRVPYAVPYDILTSYPDGEYWIIDDTTRRAAAALKETLNEFRIQADVTGIRKGPVITMFEILPAPGVKLSKIVGLQDNIALRLAASSVRIVAPIPGKHAVGIEVPNQRRSIVSFRELIEADIASAKKMEIPVVLGKDITGEAQFLDLASTPHLLIAGSTGSGKSVCVNSIILSILYKRSPEDVKLILIDPKIVELKLYNDIAHLLAPVITEPKKAFQALQYCLCEMERRYALLDGMGVRDIKSYNKRIKERNIATEKLPYIVIIIDEFADLMATTGKELESTVARLCAMSRAVGIHLVLATQRPSIDVITGLIKANIPTRIAFMVASKMDSRIIIDQVGAEKLLGRGDMLYAGAVDPFPVRIQGAFVSEEEVERVVEHVKTLGEPEYIDEEMFVEDDEDEILDQSLFSDGEDPLYEKALEIVLLAGKASASYIQRKLKIGYNRAARLVEDMEARGIVGPANGSKPREVVHHP